MIRLLLVGVVVLGGAVALADEKDKPQPKKVETSPELEGILTLVNKERAKEKLPALTLDPTLCKAAQQYAEVMAKNDKLQHRLDGRKAGERVETAGYGWKTVAENIASGEGEKNQPAPTAAELVKGWMASESARKAILNGKHVHAGLGMARSKKGNYYYSQVFASPKK